MKHQERKFVLIKAKLNELNRPKFSKGPFVAPKQFKDIISLKRSSDQ